jgi:hypothetical protein
LDFSGVAIIYVLLNPVFALLSGTLLSAPDATLVSQNLLAALFSLPPTLLLWTGLQLKAWREARKVRLGASR